MKSKPNTSARSSKTRNSPSEYEIQEVKGHKILYGQLYYQIKWTNYRDPTLEPLENLSKAKVLLDQYKQNKLQQYLLPKTKFQQPPNKAKDLSKILSNLNIKVNKLKRQKQSQEEINAFNIHKKLKEVRERISNRGKNKSNVEITFDLDFQKTIESENDPKLFKIQSFQISSEKIVKEQIKQHTFQSSSFEQLKPSLIQSQMVDENDFYQEGVSHSLSKHQANQDYQSDQSSSSFVLFQIDQSKIICDSESQINQSQQHRHPHNIPHSQHLDLAAAQLSYPIQYLFTHLLTQNGLQQLSNIGYWPKIITIQHTFKYNQNLYFIVTVQNDHRDPNPTQEQQQFGESYSQVIVDLALMKKYFNHELNHYISSKHDHLMMNQDDQNDHESRCQI